MPVIGFNIREISAFAEEKKVDGKIDVNSTPVIKSIKKRDLNVSGVDNVLAVEFAFLTSYAPRVGEISIKGEVLYQTDEAKHILAMWKDKKFETKAAVDVLNSIFKRCLIKAVSIADDLRLPPPLTMPTVSVQNKKEASAT